MALLSHNISLPANAECVIPVCVFCELPEGSESGISVKLTASIPALHNVDLQQIFLNSDLHTARVELRLGQISDQGIYSAQVQLDIERARPWSPDGDWGHRLSELETFNISVNVGTVKLIPEPRVLIFRQPTKRITVRISPPDGVAIRLDVPDPGPHMGYWPSRPNVNVATCDDPMEFEATCLVDQPGYLGEMVIHSTDLAWECRIPGYLVSPVPATTPPSVVYSIDFGTSSTSIIRRDYRTGGATISLGPKRFPSDIYIKHPHAPYTWSYFGAAHGAYEEDRNTGNQPGILVRSLKTAIRSPIVADSFERLGLSPHLLLRQFLKRLLHEYICNDINMVLGNPNPEDVCFIFTIPVLDNDIEMETQRDETLAAARDVGYENYGQLSWYREPEAAMLEVLWLYGNPGFGREVVVFDSGAGTTDIASAKVLPSGTGYRFDALRNSSVRCFQAQESGELPEDQIGGEALTLLMGVALARWWLSANRNNDFNDPIAQREATKWFIERIGSVEQREVGYTSEGEGGLNLFERSFPSDSNAWHTTAPFFIKKLEDIKRAIIAGADAPPLPDMPTSFNYRNIFERALSRFRTLMESGLANCELDPRPNVLLFCVGGNAQIDSVSSLILNFYAGAELASVEDPMLAVVRGASRLFDVQHDQATFGIRVRREISGHVDIYKEVARGDPFDGRLHKFPLIPIGYNAKFHVEICLHDVWHLIAKPIEVVTGETFASVDTTIRSDRVTLDIRCGDKQWQEEVKLP